MLGQRPEAAATLPLQAATGRQRQLQRTRARLRCLQTCEVIPAQINPLWLPLDTRTLETRRQQTSRTSDKERDAVGKVISAIVHEVKSTPDIQLARPKRRRRFDGLEEWPHARSTGFRGNPLSPSRLA